MVNTIENGPEFDIPLVEAIDPVEQPLEYIEAVRTDLATNAYIRYTSSQFKQLHENLWAAHNAPARGEMTKDWYFNEVAELETQIHALWIKEDPEATIRPILEELARGLNRLQRVPVIELDDSDLEERQSSYFTTSMSNGHREYKSSTEQKVTLKR